MKVRFHALAGHAGPDMFHRTVEVADVPRVGDRVWLDLVEGEILLRPFHVRSVEWFPTEEDRSLHPVVVTVTREVR